MKFVRDLKFEHIWVNDSSGAKNSGFVITGLPGHPVENLSFKDIRAIFPGGATRRDLDDTNAVAELTPENLGNRWPEIGNLRHVVPAGGFYARHVKGLSLESVAFSTAADDLRPAIVLDDVTEIQTNKMVPVKNAP